MRDDFKYMLGCLKDEWVPLDVIKSLFGVKDDDELLWNHFVTWARQLPTPREVLQSSPIRISRHAFESYLRYNQILPLKQAAARLGMKESSFAQLLPILEDKMLIIMNHIHFSSQFVPESWLRGFHTTFPDLRHSIFSTHSDYCAQLHVAIKKNVEFDVEPILCETSVALKQEPPDYAYEYDCLTDAPIGLRYQVWLNFGKPISLRPDACSLKLYSEHEDILRSYVFGGRIPEIPDSLAEG